MIIPLSLTPSGAPHDGWGRVSYRFMMQRKMTFLDRLISEADNALRTVEAHPRAQQERPDSGMESELGPADAELSASLMRVNHSGEIAAQALYRGQALVARDAALRTELLHAADEEHDHLAWCQDRAEELGGRTSLLAPLWYAGSFAIGMVAGLAGDKYSLGFLDETEKQVAEHLDGHLQRLPEGDDGSRKILQRMHEDELKHANKARELGGKPLPDPVKKAMRLMSGIMTGASFRI
jgi:ubiquinone biosynthesis monooxygenase Coq7